MESSFEITRLCEAWWGRLADNAKADQHRFAEQFLSLLGWQNFGPNGKPGSVIPFPEMDENGTTTTIRSSFHFSYILRGGHTSLAAHFVMPGTLEPPTLITQQGLDFCETTRHLVMTTTALNIDYAFITDLNRSYLYDARVEELLLTADSPTEFRRDIAETLFRSNIERGSLEETRRQPRSHTARQLREWSQQWVNRLTDEYGLEEESGYLLIDRLLILRYLLDHDILKRTGWRLRMRFLDLLTKTASTNTRGCGRQLRSLFHDIWFDWKADLYAPDTNLDSVLEQDTITAPLLREFALHSRNKFTIATLLESFNYGDATEKARVRMVPDGNEERDSYLAQRRLTDIDSTHIDIDLADEGYRAVFYWFDRLITLYEHLETEFDTQSYTEPTLEQEGMDLFEWSEVAAKRPQALTNKFQYAIENGITFYFSTPRQFRTARLMLYLHLINRYDQTGQRFTHFPRMTDTFRLRPRILDSDRRWIYQAKTAEDEWSL